MKERPILFSAPMVRALLAGTKTQTRRVVKGAALNWLNDRFDPEFVAHHENNLCPYGQPGDRLWVRETWAAIHFSFDPETGYCDDLHGSHDIPPAKTPYWTPVYAVDDDHEKHIDDRGFPWRPSIHMPSWASRITLEIVSVRVERLNDISEDDAESEGIEYLSYPTGGDDYMTFWRDYSRTHEQADGHPFFDDGHQRVSFRTLWESINGAGSWESNPWVWVVEFRRL